MITAGIQIYAISYNNDKTVCPKDSLTGKDVREIGSDPISRNSVRYKITDPSI